MTQITTQTDSFAEAFEQSAGGRRGEPDWLDARRAAALEYVLDTGLPGPRDEAWRFTNLKPIRQARFALAEDAPRRVSSKECHGLQLPELDGPRMVFVDGRFAADLSELDGLPPQVSILPINEAWRAPNDRLEAILSEDAGSFADAFAALNVAFMLDGAYVHVPRGVVVESPIYLLSISTDTGRPTMSHLRHVLLIDEAAQATVVEHTVALGDAVYLNNTVTQLFAGDGAVARHYFVEQESDRAYNIATLKTHQRRDTDVRSHTALFGGALVRNNVHTVLAGEGGHCLVNGLFVGRGSQHMDNHMRVEHAAPKCDSRQFYKGILDGHAGGVFTGRIYVHRDAQKTDAKQTSQNLLLSDTATMNAQPQLEIHADDVKCTHGATTGQLDPQAMLYLRSRGIDADTARAMLIYAFVAESLERVQLEPLKRGLARLLLTHLPHGANLDVLPEPIR